MRQLLFFVIVFTFSCFFFCSDKSLNPTTITDKDGNIYHSITIGSQVWMVENLKTTKFNDGTEIPLVMDDSEWIRGASPKYTWYNNDSAKYKEPYGALYNWYCVKTNKLAPVGWHVPTDADWHKLLDFLGDSVLAGGKLKETGTLHWVPNNTGATNETGFTALPGGLRQRLDGWFWSIGTWGEYWSSTSYGDSDAILWEMNAGQSDLRHGYIFNSEGLSVRCIKD